ncbi:hypothetical protein AB0B94_30325 [Micromonospora sp. NPDC048986]|uniref:hypothetical protein n=1 Tax=Micromonospora sp. NPDC048986 TaxID=3155644 RepID=UPI0033C2C28B
MPNAQLRTRRATRSAQRTLDWPRIKHRCQELGASTNIEAAFLMQMSPSTLDGLRLGRHDTKLSVVLLAAEILEMPLDEMFTTPVVDAQAA